jgi:hypothetical protein
MTVHAGDGGPDKRITDLSDHAYEFLLGIHICRRPSGES